MTTLFTTQLISSFIIGGGIIAALSLIAEKVNKKIAGPILSLPSTILVSYFFIGLTISPEAVVKIVPTTIVGTGATLLFATTYLYLSKIKTKKPLSMIVSLLGGLIVWFIISTPLAVYKFSNLILAFVGYGIAMAIGYYFLTKKVIAKEKPSQTKYTIKETLARACFAGFVVVLAVFLAKQFDLFWGGILTAFPAAFSSTLLILHYRHNSNFLFRTFYNVPLGLLVSIAFPLSAKYSYPALGLTWGSIVAYLFAVLVLMILYFLQKDKKHF